MLISARRSFAWTSSICVVHLPLNKNSPLIDTLNCVPLDYKPTWNDACTHQKYIHIYPYNLSYSWRYRVGISCRNLTLRECEDETHTPEMGTWESFGTPKTSEFDCRGQNTSHWGVLYIIGKLSKFRCRKWACMGHLDIFSTRYGKKKGLGVKLAI